MITLNESNRSPGIPKQTLLKLGLLILVGILVLATILLPLAIRPTSYPLEVGNVAPQDFRAPRSLTYESQVLTEQTRADAASGVLPVYLPTDPSITRRQIERLRMTLAFISTVRADAYASTQDKLNDLSYLSDITLQQETANQLIFLPDNRWQSIQEEALRVLEQVMRDPIREDNLHDSTRRVPTLVSFSMPESQAAIVAELVGAFVTANSLYSPEQTEAARQAMRDSIQPIERTYVVGETIVQRGQVINPAILEALKQFGLVQPQDNMQELLASISLVLVAGTFIGLYYYRLKPSPSLDLRSLALISFLFLIFLFGARLIIPNRTVLPYLYPIPAFGLTIACLFSLEDGLVLSLILSILAAYNLPNSLDLTLYYAIGSLCGILVLNRAHRVVDFFWAGMAVGGAATAIIMAYRFPDSITDWLGLATLIGSGFFNGLASSSLTLLLQFLVSQILGLTTALQLLEISRPDHPLLQLLLRNAPGTYQHSLQVANLAEQAAEMIGADALLTRVGALFHDAGKALNPLFFIENQVAQNLNPHDDLDPATSAATIIDHVTDGLTLSRKYRLPPRISDFISEHHGTLITKYQYMKALEAAGGDENQVDKNRFRYPGPRPQSRETALLMLADGVEARARAEIPKDEDSLKSIIKCVIDRCEKEGQLDDTRLTLRDLSRIAGSFSSTLKGIYHPRIAYPELPASPGLLLEAKRAGALSDNPPATAIETSQTSNQP